MRVTAIAVAAVLSCLPSGLRAQGDDQARARALFSKAEARFASGEFKEALDLYQQAYRVKPLPGFHLNIGQCYFNLEQYERAVHHYRQYLRSESPKHREEAEKLIKLGQQKLAEQRRDAPAQEGQEAEVPPPEVPSAEVPPAEQPPPPASHETPGPPTVVLGLGTGVYIPTSDLGVSFLVGIDAAYQLPWLGGKFGVGGGLAYSQPTTSGTIMDDRVPGGSASYDSTMRELVLDLLATYRLFLRRQTSVGRIHVADIPQVFLRDWS